MDSIKEDYFYKLCDAIDELSDEIKNITDMYFPTVEEIKAHHVEKNINKFLPLIMYFSTDPLKDVNGFEDEIAEEYKKSVEYCKNLIQNLNLQ